jgi:hypothetical protein
MDLIAGLMTKAPNWLLAISGVVTALTAVTMLTPTKMDDKVLGHATKYINMLLKLCNMGAGNILANKNKDDKGKY